MKNWSTVRIETDLHKRLAKHKDTTGIPVSTIIRMALEQYWKEPSFQPNGLAQTLQDMKVLLTRLVDNIPTKTLSKQEDDNNDSIE